MIFNNYINVHDHFDSKYNPMVSLMCIKYRSKKLNTDYAQTFINSCKLASLNTNIKCYDNVNNILLRPSHGPQAYKRSQYETIYNMYKDLIENSISRFRETKNYNQYLFSAYVIFNKLCKLKGSTYEYISMIRKNYNSIEKILNSNVKELCINDIATTTVEDKKWLSLQLNMKFPNKCKYEI